jgi:glutathione S-transferase
LKLYDAARAPNPRRVRIFMAEKGIAFADSGTDSKGEPSGAPRIERIEVDLASGLLRSDAFRALNPLGQIPVLELDDGTAISESVAICRYLEGLYPEPSLFGADARTAAVIEMWNRRIELGLNAPVGIAWVNGPVVARVAPGRFRQLPEAREDAEARARAFQRRMDGWLAERPWVAGDAYSIADITALCSLDFASALVNLAPDPALTHLARWHAAASARPSASA